MKSILHLKEDTEYQIPLREDDKGTDRAKVGADVETTVPNPEAEAKKETEAEKAANGKKVDDKKKVDDEEETAATQSQDDVDATEVYEEDLDETQNQEHSNTENSSNDTNTESVPPADTAKAALDEMKKLASQGGVIHPSLFISNFSKILGLMERAMQLQVKESGSVTKEEASKATEQAETLEKTEVPEQTETPTGDKQGELNVNTNNNRS